MKQLVNGEYTSDDEVCAFKRHAAINDKEWTYFNISYRY